MGPLRKDSLRNSRVLIEQLPLLPMNSSLPRALLLLAVIIVLDECWGFLKIKSRFQPQCSSPQTRPSDIPEGRQWVSTPGFLYPDPPAVWTGPLTNPDPRS